MQNIFDRAKPDSFLACDAAFRELLDEEFVGDCIRASLSAMRENPYASGDWTLHQLVLCRGPGYALSLALINESTRFIHTSPFLAMYSPFGETPLRYERYRLPPTYSNAVFDPTVSLEHAGSGSVLRGEVLHVHPEREVHDFRIAMPQLVLKFASSPWQMLEWLFDRESLLPRQANDAALSTTQLRVASYLLGRLGHRSSIEPLKQLSDSSVPSVRWAAIQNLGRLDAVEALKKLERATRDPHPHIRHAAQKSLAQRGASPPTG
ncbi:MAG: hypothetical protein NVS9B10_07210 [Nevskia sp.]